MALGVGLGSSFDYPFTGTATLANMPGWFKRAWRGWRRGFAGTLRALVPSSQATVLYFSNAGNDTTGDGSAGNPYATVAKAQSLMGNGKEFRFRYGDIFKETNALSVSNTGVVCRAYAFGGRTAKDGLPIISKFQADYSSGGWALTAAQTYTYERTDANAATVAWVREKNSIGQQTVYRKVTSIAEVESNAGSWYATGTTVYIHPHDDRNPTSDGRVYESVLNNAINGILVTGDLVYIRELRFDGWGCNSSSASAFYGIQVSSAGATKAIVVDRCEAYYNGRHNLGLTCGGAGCQMLWDHCKAGWTTPNGDTPLVDYSANGSHVCMWEEPHVVAGNLPIGANTWYPYASGCSAWVCHTGSGTVSFTCMYKPTIVDGPFGCGWVGSCQNAPNCDSDVTLARAFIVEVRLRLRDFPSYIEGLKKPWSNVTGLTFLQQGNPYNIHINCWFDCRFLGASNAPTASYALMNSIDGYFVNPVFEGSFNTDSQVGGTSGIRSWFFGAVANEKGKFWNGWFHIRTRGPGRTGMEGQCASNNNLTYCSPDMKFRNCVFTAQTDNGVSFYFALNNNKDASGNPQVGDARSMLNNAYGCNAGKTDTYRGYDQDPYLVEIPTNLAIGQYPAGSELASVNQQRLPGGYDLEYDFYWAPRNAANTPRGPFETADSVY